MLKKLTITIDAEVYDGLHSVVGRRRISRFLNDLARPHVVGQSLAAGALPRWPPTKPVKRSPRIGLDGLISDVAEEPSRHGG